MTKGLRRIYSKIASVYELVNHILTFGLDGLWRLRTAKIAAMGGGSCWMDICSGTGEMAIALQHIQKQPRTIVAMDFSVPMLRKASRKHEITLLSFVLADTQALPFRSNIFDLITIAFATRNLNLTPNLLNQAFTETYRSLTVNGRFVNVETSQPPSTFIRRLFHLYAQLIVKRVGQLLFGSKTGAAFLAQSIQRFYKAESLTQKLQESGFSQAGYQPLFFGAVAIHQAVK